jgi:hypothetical protein
MLFGAVVIVFVNPSIAYPPRLKLIAGIAVISFDAGGKQRYITNPQWECLNPIDYLIVMIEPDPDLNN